MPSSPEISGYSLPSSEQAELSDHNESSENLESIRFLLDQIEGSSLYDDYDPLTVSSRRRLRDGGTLAAQQVLNSLADRRTEAGETLYSEEIYNHYCWLRYCADQSMSRDIGELLHSPEVQQATHRSLQIQVFKTLQRIGTIDNVSQLVRYLHERRDNYQQFAGYSDNEVDRLTRLDCHDISYVLATIQRRMELEGLYHNPTINAAMAYINAYLAQIGASSISWDTELSNANLELIDEDFERKFIIPFNERDGFDNANAQTNRADWPSDEDRELVREIETEDDEAANRRIDVIRRLRDMSNPYFPHESANDFEQSLERHFWQVREEQPTPHSVTLGIEVEIRENAVKAPTEYAQASNEIKDDYRRNLREIYWGTSDAGVPRGDDMFWEFAHQPSHYYLTLSREVQELMRLCLINKDYHKHSLHLTIGGVSSQGPAGDQVYLLARALEATGWSTTGGRLLRPYLTGSPTWNYKGYAGVKERYLEQLELDTDKAIEIRTMQLQSLTGLNRMLRSAQLLGSALKARQELDQGNDNDINAALASAWDGFSQEVSNLFLDYGLDIPSEVWETPSAHNKSEYNREFHRLAALLQAAQRRDPSPEGQTFVHETRLLVIRYRKMVADILYPRDQHSELPATS